MMSVPENWELLLPVIPPLSIIPESLFEPVKPRLTVQPARASEESRIAPPIAIERIVKDFIVFPIVNFRTLGCVNA